MTRLIAEEERLALISFLSHFANFADEENILVQSVMTGLKSSLKETQIFEQCGRIKLKAKSEFSKEQILYFCTEIVDAMKSTDCLPCLLDVLTSVESIPANNEDCND